MKSIRKIFFPLTIFTLFCPTGASRATEPSAVVSRPYVALGGGASVDLSGYFDITSPAMQVEVGFRWRRFAVEASMVWSELKWTAFPRYVCIAIYGTVCPANHVDGDLVGKVIQGRFYLFRPEHSMQLYLIGGLGGQLLTYKETHGRSGNEWLIMLRAGVGVETAFFGGISLDLSAIYSYTHLLGEPDPFLFFPRRLQNINLVGAIKYSF